MEVYIPKHQPLDKLAEQVMNEKVKMESVLSQAKSTDFQAIRDVLPSLKEMTKIIGGENNG